MVINVFQKGDGKKSQSCISEHFFQMKYIFSNSLSTKIEFQKVPRTSHLISGWFSPVSLLLTVSSKSLFCPSCDDLVRLQGLGLGWHWWCDCSGVNRDCGHGPDLGRRWSLATKVANADAGFCSWPHVRCARWVSGLGASLARLKRAAGCSRLGAAAPCSVPCGYAGAGGLCAGPKLARCQWNRHRAPQMAVLGALPFSGSSDTQEEAVTEKYRGAFSKCAGPVGAGTCFALKPNLELSWSWRSKAVNGLWAFSNFQRVLLYWRDLSSLEVIL